MIVLPKGGVVLSFPRSSLRCFVVSSFRRVVLVSRVLYFVLSFSRSTVWYYVLLSFRRFVVRRVVV